VKVRAMTASCQRNGVVSALLGTPNPLEIPPNRASSGLLHGEDPLAPVEYPPPWANWQFRVGEEN
jgi:hypothetical protein